MRRAPEEARHNSPNREEKAYSPSPADWKMKG